MTARPTDRRGFIRVPFRAEVVIEAGKAVIRSEGELDISMGGLRVPSRDSLPEHSPCRATITLNGAQDHAMIQALGRIVRSEPGSIAVEFNELDVDSYNHLRQLILNNAGDPERAEQEFDAHWGIKRPAR